MHGHCTIISILIRTFNRLLQGQLGSFSGFFFKYTHLHLFYTRCMLNCIIDKTKMYSMELCVQCYTYISLYKSNLTAAMYKMYINYELSSPLHASAPGLSPSAKSNWIELVKIESTKLRELAFLANWSSEPTKFLSCDSRCARLTEERLAIWCPC